MKKNCDRKTYETWIHIKQRCGNAKDKSFKDYGGRGIKVCERWLSSYENFKEDMGEAPKGLFIERIDNNKGYNKENCIWTDRKTQSRNKRSNVLVTLKNETKCVLDWSIILNMNCKTIYMRISRGWNPETALTTPIRKGNYK